MTVSRIKTGVLAFCFIGPFSYAQALKIPDNIVMTESEKTLVGQGEIIVRELPTGSKKGQAFEAIGLANASIGSLVQIVTDYDKYPEFMPNINKVEILEQAGNTAILDFTLDLPLGKVKKYRLRITLLESDSETAKIQWTSLLLPGLKPEETIKETSGYWLLKSRSPKMTLLLYQVYTDPGPIPFGLEWIVDILSKNSIPEALLKTRERAENLIRE